MPTPHNSAEKNQVAPLVLMPGDPLRARFIAQNYLENVQEITSVRSMLGFTGIYNGKPVTVMGSGMGMPSIGIYSYELFSFYDVQCIIRVGSAGGYDEKLKIFDVILATEVYSESTYALCQNGFRGNHIKADDETCEKIRKSANALGIPLIEGKIHSSDVFYHEARGEEPYWKKVMREQNCIAVEMESFALYHNARACGKKAACLVTISDLLGSKHETTVAQREQGFTRMMEIALGVCLA